jgi:YihY family inner membrane protein
MKVKPLWGFLLQSIRSFSKDNCTQMAAAISYYVLFSIVPLTVFLVSIFGLVIRDDGLRNDITNEIVDSLGLQRGDVSLDVNAAKVGELHGPGVASQVQLELDRMGEERRERIADALLDGERVEVIPGVPLSRSEIRVSYENPVSETLREVSQVSGALTIVGLLGMAWTSSTMFGAIRRALNIVWGINRPRPFVRQKLQDLSMVIGVGVLLFLSVVGTGLLRTVRQLSDDALGPLSTGTGPFWALLPFVLPGVFSFAVFSFVYRLVPAARVRWRDVWVGALVAALLFELMKNVFAIYVANFGSYDVLYGSLGGILLFLTGTFLSANILLFGAEMVSHMPDLRRGAFDPVPEESPQPKPPLPEQARQAAFGFVRGLFVHAEPHEDSQEPQQTPQQTRHR